MKKYYIYPKFEIIKRKKKNWGYIEQDDSGTILRLFINPNFAFARPVNDQIQKKLIKALEQMDLVVLRLSNRKE